MKKLIVLMITVMFLTGCSDFLDVQPTDKVTPDAIFGSEKGIESFLANLYQYMPI